MLNKVHISDSKINVCFLTCYTRVFYVNLPVMKKYNLTGLDLSECEQFAIEIGEKHFRGRQLFSWLYTKGARDFESMTDLSKTLRSKLIENAQIGQVELINTIKSNETNTQKFLFKVSGGHFIESVYIPEKERNTLCISSQVGCALNCSFCATGAMGFSRNLSVGEITDQLLFAQN